jgi:hypothetical protein
MARPVLNGSCFQLVPFQSQACGPGCCTVCIELVLYEPGSCTFAFAVAGEFLGWWFVILTPIRDFGI